MTVKDCVLAFCPPFLRPWWDRLESSPFGYRLARGAFWSLAGSVTSHVLLLLSSIIVARMLGKSSYGQLAMVQSTVSMFGIFAGFGLGVTATKFVAELRSTNPERAGRIVGLSGIVAAVTGSVMSVTLFVFAPWLAEHTFSAPELSDMLRIACTLLFLSALYGGQTGTLLVFEAFRTIARVSIMVGLASFPLLIAGAYFGGLRGTVTALVLNLCINWALNNRALRKEARRHAVKVSFQHWRSELQLLWRFSLPVVLSSLMIGPTNWICGTMLVRQADGFGEMGIYNAANQWKMAIFFVPGLLSQVFLPLLSSGSAAEPGSRQSAKIIGIGILLNGGTALAVALPVALLGHQIMRAYGPGFADGVGVLRALAFTSALMAVNDTLRQAFTSKSKVWTALMFNGLWAVSLLLLAGLLIQHGYGAQGLASATLVTYMLHIGWQYLYYLFYIRRRGGAPAAL